MQIWIFKYIKGPFGWIEIWKERKWEGRYVGWGEKEERKWWARDWGENTNKNKSCSFRWNCLARSKLFYLRAYPSLFFLFFFISYQVIIPFCVCVCVFFFFNKIFIYVLILCFWSFLILSLFSLFFFLVFDHPFFSQPFLFLFLFLFLIFLRKKFSVFELLVLYIFGWMNCSFIHNFLIKL